MMQAGAAKVEITPRAGTHLAGSGAGEHRPAQVVLDPLYARAVVFESGGRKVCFLSLDVTIVTEEWTEHLRRAAAERFGFDPDAVMVHATQTHSAPSLGHFMFDPDFPELPPDIEYLRGGETPFFEFAAARAIEAIGAADRSLRPVQIGVGSALRDGLAFNRRGVTREGKAVMPWLYSRRQYPLGPTHLRYLEGPTDPEVGVFGARDESLRMVAMLLHFTCHPVNVFATQYHAVSADWPGIWAGEMENRFGGGALVLNGCCGNLNPWPAFEPDFVPDHRRMGQALAETASAVVGRLEFSEAEALAWKVRHVPLPLKPADPERLARAEQVLAEHPAPRWSEERPGLIDGAWFQAASVKSVELMRRRRPDFPYEIQVLRVGDTVFVGLPGEPFVEGQLAIKVGSPAYPTYVAHATTHYVGYVPTASAFPRGGHEVDFSYWAKLAPESLDRIVENALDLIREVMAA
jgi:neutral ceramidase